MGVLDNLFKATRISRSAVGVEKEPKYMEVEWAKTAEAGQGYIRVVNFNDFADVEGVLDYLRDRRNVVILKIKPRLLQEKMELKRAIKRIQRTAQAIGGDIVGIKEDIIIITPPKISICRSPVETSGESLESTVA